jgi:coniferyl-aldehyde dehydrogenase
VDTQTVVAKMEAQLDALRGAQRQGGYPSAGVRKERLLRCIDLLVDNQDALAEALDKDYGGRSTYITRMSEILQPLGHLKHAIKHLEKWMKPEKRSPMFPMGLLGGKAWVQYQPLGVVGIMSPWNFPIAMIFHPIANALAAGNRIMIKPSEFNPKTSELLQQLFQQYFTEDEIVLVNGGPEIGAAFAGLDLDHIIFTGASSVGRMVMAAASRTLTPVTLELGGKSPTIIGKGADVKKAAELIVSGKCLNAGQACLSPDYVFVPRAGLESFIEQARATFNEQYPDVSGNEDYPAVINARHYERIVAYIEEARQAGARVEALAKDSYSAEEQKVPLHLIIDPDDGLKVMQDEIFGPVLVVKAYDDVPSCVDFINDRPRPLGLYYFGDDRQEQQYVLDYTLSGGVTLNDVLFHVANVDLPFGGVGNSGMGNYQGRDGFRTFSHARSVYKQGWVNLGKLAGTNPPYQREKLDKMLAGQIKK